jgi:hypothetical protein
MAGPAQFTTVWFMPRAVIMPRRAATSRRRLSPNISSKDNDERAASMVFSKNACRIAVLATLNLSLCLPGCYVSHEESVDEESVDIDATGDVSNDATPSSDENADAPAEGGDPADENGTADDTPARGDSGTDDKLNTSEVEQAGSDKEAADDKEAGSDKEAADDKEAVDGKGTGDEQDKGTGALRHAVFFSFKETSSPEDVQKVAEAFAALPSKVDTIIDFEWGTNNSTEDHDDGFTHCFVLTFKDDAGRKVYLPHPEHAAFGDVLRPHVKDVFVIDYWGDPANTDLPSPLRHVVFFKFKDEASAEDVQTVVAAFESLPQKIDSIKDFEWGTNNSPEKHDDGFTHCFMVTFEDEKGREAYLPHPAHSAFVEVLGPFLDKVRVLDYTAQKP